MRKGTKYYEDDFDDGYYDEPEDDDWYAEEEEERPAPQPKPELAKPSKPGPKASKPSAMSKGLTAPTSVAKPKGGGKGTKAPPAAAKALAPVAPTKFAFDTPSPDDLARAAAAGRASARQASDLVARLAIKDPPQQGGDAAAAPAANGSSSSSPAPARPLSEYRADADLLRACEKELAVRASEESKPGLHLVVLGHVDAGKSTLVGRLLYELDALPERAAQRAQREAATAGQAASGWAWLLDARPEERERGVTVEVGTTRFETRRRRVGMLDAPGHRDFVPAMIAGAAQADAALLVVDGAPGGFEAGFRPAAGGAIGGQTREHARLARALGIRQLALVCSKLDAVPGGAAAQRARFEGVCAQVLPFLADECGYRDVPCVPVCAPAGDNLTAPGALGEWWRGPTLEQVIDGFAPPPAAPPALPLRVTVTEAPGARGGTAAVAGKVVAGALRAKGSVAIVPGTETATVRSVAVNGETGRAGAVALAGDAAEISVGNLEETAHLAPGTVLCDPAWPVPLVNAFRARLLILDAPRPVLPGQQVSVHCLMACESGRFRRLGRDAPGHPPARLLLSGQTGIADIVLERPIAMERAADVADLGRVVLREGGRTLGVGTVIEILS